MDTYIGVKNENKKEGVLLESHLVTISGGYQFRTERPSNKIHDSFGCDLEVYIQRVEKTVTLLKGFILDEMKTTSDDLVLVDLLEELAVYETTLTYMRNNFYNIVLNISPCDLNQYLENSIKGFKVSRLMMYSTY